MDTISIIVPVFQVEHYLPRCIESIQKQTYSDLDIILIDDGSTDRSGEICDRYAKEDPRIRVYHTENRGLSAARNLGLEKARENQSQYIAFADGDDYMEPQLCEELLQCLVLKDADIAVCGYTLEWVNNSREVIPRYTECSGNKALLTLLKGRLNNGVWGKLYRKLLFDSVVFPEERTFEDIAVMYQLVMKARRIIPVEKAYYHWVMRFNSITHQKSLKNLFDRWTANKERFDRLSEDESIMTDQGLINEMLKGCAGSVWLIWREFYGFSKEERKNYCAQLHPVAKFIREQIPLFASPEWSRQQRISTLFTRSDSGLSLLAAYYGYKAYRFFYPRKEIILYDEKGTLSG